jgi:hypothetical protein
MMGACNSTLILYQLFNVEVCLSMKFRFLKVKWWDFDSFLAGYSRLYNS